MSGHPGQLVSGLAERTLRNDIQVLRAIAVLLVLGYHARMPGPSAGYLGVDVFFVISGYLMTRMIANGIASGTFTFRGFYFRRARRLLPAALATFLVTSLLAPLVLGDAALEDFKAQIAGSLGFVANLVLWRQTGYFQNEAELQPLLHVWSLSLEEQYYFVLPFLFVVVPRRFWKPLAILIVCASASLCFALVDRWPSATFYFLPTRAWELGIGSAGALITLGPRMNRFTALAFWPALVAVLVVPFFPLGARHPGVDALIVCLATMVLIWRAHPLFDAGIPGMQTLVWVGNLSYVLYLVHWPLFAFFNNVWVGPDEGIVVVSWRVGLLAGAFALAWLLNRTIEEPFRHFTPERQGRFLVRSGMASACLLVLALGTAHLRVGADVDFTAERRANRGLAPECNARGGVYRPDDRCRTSSTPQVLVWGDSYAMALVPGIATDFSDVGIAQATKDGCGPMLGVAPVPVERPDAWASDCIGFNSSILEYLSKTKSLRTIVISSAIYNNLPPKIDVLLTKDGGQERIVEADGEAVVAGLSRTIDAVRSLGREIVLVAPPPTNGVNIGACHERMASGLFYMGAETCDIPSDAYRQRNAMIFEVLAAVADRTGVNVISFDEYLCSGASCRTEVSGVPLYRDHGHLSYRGSVALSQGFHLRAHIEAASRTQ